jgi:predicted nucleic acid-binding protein
MRADVFIDSGAFVAWLVRADRDHAAATALFGALPRTPATSLAVVAETYAFFLHRFGEDAARLFRLALAELPGLVLLPLDTAHHAAVGRKLERLRGQKLTYVDASSLVFLAAHRIPAVWGTDHHLALEGARVEPGPRGANE